MNIHLYLFFSHRIQQKSGNIAVLDLVVFYFQNILGNLVSDFLEMIIFWVGGWVCSLKKELG